MDGQTIINAISTLGFPIVMCGLLFWYMIKQQEEHAEETKAMREAINSLQVAITELTTSIRDRG